MFKTVRRIARLTIKWAGTSAWSPNSHYFAVLERCADSAYLNIYEVLRDGQLLRSIVLHKDHRKPPSKWSSSQLRARPAGAGLRSQNSAIRWSKADESTQLNGEADARSGDSRRILVCTGNRISVYDLCDEEWSAEIVLGEASDLTHVEFGSTHASILVLSEFNAGLHIFLLESQHQGHASIDKRGQEHLLIKSPKGSKCSAFRPRSGHLALVTKENTTEIVAILHPNTYTPLSSNALQTVDAQGLRWSPNGSWLVVWDLAILGTKVVLYTAEGAYYRTYLGHEGDDDGDAVMIDSGVRDIQWSPDSRILALGMGDGRIELLSATTLTLLSTLLEPMSFGSIGRELYIEDVESSLGIPQYSPAPKQEQFPYTFDASTSTSARSIAMSFNCDEFDSFSNDPPFLHQWVIGDPTGPQISQLV
ncbi:hypothetical protein KEM55_002690, partial [Ascosphaera atra]